MSRPLPIYSTLQKDPQKMTFQLFSENVQDLFTNFLTNAIAMRSQDDLIFNKYDIMNMKDVLDHELRRELIQKDPLKYYWNLVAKNPGAHRTELFQADCVIVYKYERGSILVEKYEQ